MLRGDRVSADRDWIVKGKSPSAKTITVNATSLNRKTIKQIQYSAINYAYYESKKSEYKLIFRILIRTGKSQELENFVEQKSIDLK